MSQDDVQYALGEPSEKRASDNDLPATWIYKKEYSHEMKLVGWNHDNRVEAIVCYSHEDYPFGCDRVAGIHLGDSEADILARFGDPLEPPSTVNGSKHIIYGTSEVALAFVLKQDRVRLVALRTGPLTTDTADKGK